MTNTPLAIDVQHLTVSMGSHTILEDLSFSIPEGSVTAVIGPNGSGKTTLLQTLMGLVEPKSGEVSILGKAPETVRHRVGYVPQRFSFDRTFPVTVREFFEFSHPASSEAEMRQRLHQVDSEDAMERRLSELSGGQLQRVLIARALLRSPSLLYLDEPATGIDMVGEQSLYHLIAQLTADAKTTIVIVSHELEVVYRHATQVLCINKALHCHGLPQEVLTDKVLQQLYGKDSAVYRHTETHQHVHE